MNGFFIYGWAFNFLCGIALHLTGPASLIRNIGSYPLIDQVICFQYPGLLKCLCSQDLWGILWLVFCLHYLVWVCHVMFQVLATQYAV